ncbi:triose-phosphate isomerase [Rhizorhapis suberifaciens]|uniref:Triosephosphate isomerase n=1 Tax=Rhizorhapis suberifaciens TaxID=13656 RepID=A0A840HX94_9SPHN|nr:triose-phosphate isomerase [Rhizorhapis suberifaciens]MBB4642271.1 triosephosphate isomerase [Rhizorhapis suberifaciens]
MTRRKLIVGNWKMNGLLSQLREIEAIDQVAEANLVVEVGLCIPATLIHAASGVVRSVFIGAQDCHSAESGAHTGCLSAAMLSEAGANTVIVGHSERRTDQHETSGDVAAKAAAARHSRLNVILCVGETEAERDAGHAEALVSDQLLASLPEGAASEWLSIAYEPVWAIGTGRTPTMEEVDWMHRSLRDALRSKIGADADALRILYGGSMNGANAADLLSIADVDGGLVGGASLTSEKFAPIIEAAAAAG